VSRRWSWVCLEIMKSLWEAPSHATLDLAVFDTYSLQDAGSDASSNSFASCKHSVCEIFIVFWRSLLPEDILARRRGRVASRLQRQGDWRLLLLHSLVVGVHKR